MSAEQFNYRELKAFLNHLKNERNLSFIISDMIGFSSKNPALYTVLEPYIIHDNPYCIKVKSNLQLWQQCMKSKIKVKKKLKAERKPFWGVCHCGMGELIYPFFFKDYVAGFISVCGFCADEKYLCRRLHCMENRYHFNALNMRALYHDNVIKPPEDQTTLLALLGMLAFTLTLLANESGIKEEEIGENSRGEQNIMILNAINFIHCNYQKNICIEDIAEYCNCSKSHIQHLFKRYKGDSLFSYIESIRMREAKRLLKKTDLQISEIALRAGFRDPNYFAAAFRRKWSMAPGAYRRMTRP